MVKVDKEFLIEQVIDFIDERLIITDNENDYILTSDVFYFLNEKRDYENLILRHDINKAFVRKKINKKIFKGTMNFVGVYWKPTKVI